MTLLGSYLLLFYVDVVGLDPVVVGTLFLVSRVLDGFNDPIMGYVIDHLPRTKLGRFRTYLIIGTIACSINYVLLWLGPSLAPVGKTAIAYITYILFGFTFDLMDIPLNSMIPVMSDRDEDRNTLSNIKGIGYLAGTVIFLGGALPLIESFPTRRQGYHVVIIIASIFVLTFSIIGTLGIRERIHPLKAEKYPLGDIFKVLGARPVFILFLDTLISSVGGGVSSGIGLFFFIYALNRPDLYTTIVMLSVLGVIIGVIVGPILVKKIGKKTTRLVASLISLTSPLVLFFTPPEMPNIFLLMAFFSVSGVGINMILSYSIQADNMDYVEWKYGFRAEAAVASMQSFIIKAASGIGSAIGAYMLKVINYVPNADVQSPETIQGLYYLNYAIPGILSIIAICVWAFGYPLTKTKRDQMMAELTERRKLEREY